MAQLKMGVDTMGHIMDLKNHDGAPAHIRENLLLTRAMLRAQLDWVEQAIPRVEADELP
jgi:hypothetical protein